MKKIIIKLIMGPNGQPCAAWQAADEKDTLIFKGDQPIETCPALHATEIAALFLEKDNWGIYGPIQSRFLSAASAVYVGHSRLWYLHPGEKHFYDSKGFPYERCQKLAISFKAIVGADATGNF